MNKNKSSLFVKGITFLNPAVLRSFAGIFALSIFAIHFLFFFVWLALSAMRLSFLKLMDGDPQAYFVAVPVFTVGIVIILFCGRVLIDLFSFFRECRQEPSCFQVKEGLPLSEKVVAFGVLLLSAIPPLFLTLSSIQWAKKDGSGLLEDILLAFMLFICAVILTAWLFWCLPEQTWWRRLDFYLAFLLEIALWLFAVAGTGLTFVFLFSSL